MCVCIHNVCTHVPTSPLCLSKVSGPLAGRLQSCHYEVMVHQGNRRWVAAAVPPPHVHHDLNACRPELRLTRVSYAGHLRARMPAASFCFCSLVACFELLIPGRICQATTVLVYLIWGLKATWLLLVIGSGVCNVTQWTFLFCWLQGGQNLLAGHTQQPSELDCQRPTAPPPPADTPSALIQEVPSTRTRF
jgi:hypothetical protein